MVTLEYAIDTSLRIAKDGVHVTREKKFCADSLLELYTRNRLPQTGSRHPDDSRLRLESSSVNQVGNIGGTRQFIWSGEYRNSAGTSAGSRADVDPWELDAQNVTFQHFTTSEPVRDVYNINGDTFRLLNSAGSPIMMTHDVYGTQINFIFATRREPRLNSQPLINQEMISVAGQTLEQYAGLLMPMTKRKIVEYDDQGEVYRSYWEVEAQVRIATKSTWLRSTLDVGTLAIPEDLDADRFAQPLYKFAPWESTDPNEQLKTPGIIATLPLLLAARSKYALIALQAKFGSSVNTTNASPEQMQVYYQALQSFSYSEVTEPVPLTETGRVDMAAVTDPVEHPYREIEFLEYAPAPFSQFNIPQKAEG